MSGIRDQRAEAMEYLEKHKIIRLFDLLGAKLAHARPEDPNEFLVNELTRIQSLVNRQQPVTLFSEKDIENLFAVFDITGRGYITQLQYLRGNAIFFC
jgi:histidyl-tRNA synthetase